MATAQQTRLAGDTRTLAAGLVAEGILHELANDVFLTRNLAELALAALPEEAPHRHSLESILAAGDELVERVRAFQRFNAVAADPPLFRLDALVDRTVSLLRLSGLLRSADLEVDAERVTVAGVPPAPVARLVLALVVESVRALEDGARVRLVARGGDEVALAVELDGARREAGDPLPASLADELAAELGAEVIRGLRSLAVRLPVR